ncbi:hypothetical protein GGR46_004023 [Sphingomonas kyeonggiensis]|uniref:Uncharacterized protein n=1 Tax=Sphingomonas kyeonggiensis TaxID=1268553 RepID=A0A7W6JVS7_9SPHN|nr:hypothetical protein [Sphingomonas kyeonggiensis]
MVKTPLDGCVAPLHDIAETWLGAQYELEDGELQRPFAAFLETSRVLCGLLVAKTHLLDSNTNLASPKTTLDRRLGAQKSTLEAIDQLNKAANNLAGTVDGFDRAVRGRSGWRLPRLAAGDPSRDWANQAIVELSHDRNRGGAPRLVPRPCLTIRIAPHAAHACQRLDPRTVEQAQLQFPPNEKVRIEEPSDAKQ